MTEMQTDPEQRGLPPAVDVAIVGGGITGLAAAYYLRQPGDASGVRPSVAVLEGAARAGGKVVTARPDGFVIEGGPDSFITQKPDAYRLCAALGLAGQLIPTNDRHRKTYVLRGGRLHPMPEGLVLMVPTRPGPILRSSLLSPRGKARMALDLVRPARAGTGDESMAAFVERRFGREAVVRLAGPLMAGIYVGDPARLSIQATFPQYAELERQHGSLIRAARARQREAARMAPAADPPGSLFLALRDGMGTLVDALVGALDPGVVHTGDRVARLERAPDRWRLHLASGAVVEARQVVLAIPAPAAAALLAPIAPHLAAGLRAIRYVSSATVALGYAATDVAHPLDGFGFVVAADEPTPLLACTWMSSKLPGRAPAGKVLIRAFVGGARDEARANLPEPELVRTVRTALAPLLGLRGEPEVSAVYRWPGANPQYDVGHLTRVAQLEAEIARSLPGICLTGSAYRGVGLPDCIRAGRETAERVAAALGDPAAA